MATPEKCPNILVIWGDDIGISNLSCYSHGLMGYRTPNIDRIAKEGMMFTDSYGEQSCTAGRSSFITGQSVARTGLSKVGIPGAPIGMSEEIITMAGALKNQGYATGQFGKNHLGDLNHMLPTNHGFDEFFGNLYHLNAEEEPEMYDYYPKDEFPELVKNVRPRGVIHSWATDKDDPTEMPRWGKVGKQKIEDTGPLTTKRMETCDDEFVAAARDFIQRQTKAGKPWFVWLNTTHMHVFTHTKKESLGQAGRWQSPYHDTMIDHDKNVGEMLALLDEMNLADDTFVMYSTDNGPHRNSWPDGGMTPFRSEKDTNWEGAFRVPLLVRWPNKIKAGSVSNEIVQHHDWFPTFLNIAGDPQVSEKLKKGYQACGRTYKNHIDGFDLVPYLTGKAEKSPRKLFMYISDDGDILALRYDNWKVVFMEQRCKGTMQVWGEPFTRLRMPKIYNLRTDPYEFADVTSNSYYDWFLYHAYILYGAWAIADKFAATFKDFPPVQRPNSFTIDEALAMMSKPPVTTRGMDSAVLSSWCDGRIKLAILDFVSRVTTKGRADFVPPQDRIAVFDNDGTLWCEQPQQVQFFFGRDRLTTLAQYDPTLHQRQPFKAYLEHDLPGIHEMGKRGLFQVAAAEHAGMTEDAFDQMARAWLANARHPKLAVPFTRLVYQPQLELLAFLRAYGFKTFIVSGGGVGLIRAFSEEVYGVAREQVIGSSVKTHFEVQGGRCDLLKLAEINSFDDREEKVVNIGLHIGRRPILAFGNSDGDLAMLRYTRAGKGPRLALLLHHDDEEREFSYDRDFSLSPLAEALDKSSEYGLTVVSMKRDWRAVFEEKASVRPALVEV